MFEEWLNKKYRKKRRPLSVVLIPIPRNRLLASLVEGRGDIVWANLTITPERQKRVDFSIPAYPGVNELVITGPAAPGIKSLDDLVTKGVHIRPSSSYFEHLSALNKKRKKICVLGVSLPKLKTPSLFRFQRFCNFLGKLPHFLWV